MLQCLRVCVMSFSTWLQWKAKDAKTHLTLPRPWPVRGWSQRVQLDSATPVAGVWSQWVGTVLTYAITT